MIFTSKLEPDHIPCFVCMGQINILPRTRISLEARTSTVFEYLNVESSMDGTIGAQQR